MTVPKHWQIVELREVAFVQTGFAKGKVISGESVRLPYLRVANVQDGFLDLSEIKEVEVAPYEIERFRLQIGDVLLTEGGDFDKLGRGTLWRGEITNCLHQNHIFAVRTSQEFLEPLFFSYQTASPYGRKYFLECSKQSTNLASINSTQLKEFPVLLPPLAEQRAIAAILSTWDEAITLTKRLIAALRQRKQALMQILLTSEVRFPGFEGDSWSTIQLKDGFDRITRPIIEELKDVLSITATKGFVDQKSKFGRTIAGKNLGRYIHLKHGEFAYNKGNSNSYPQGCIYRLEEFQEGAVPNVYYCFSARPNTAIGGYFKYYFESGALNEQLSSLINSGVRNDGLLNLSADSFFDVEISVPPLLVQERIATVLSYADDAIKDITQLLDAVKAQKRGLMQQLLTGAIRVQVEE